MRCKLRQKNALEFTEVQICTTWGFGLDFRRFGLGFGVRGLGFGGFGLDFAVQGLGFGVHFSHSAFRNSTLFLKSTSLLN